MMVTFISQCEKKALNRTRRVLDAFANRIGDNTWQTVITQEGLLAVKKLLRRTASKNTAVSCHWIRSRARSELDWIVGNRHKFNDKGVVPVNSTRLDILKSGLENRWHTVESIALLSAVAGLFHDFGKASVLFQNKLTKKYNAKNINFEPYRHEWVSLRLFESFVNGCSDQVWLERLSVITPNDEARILESLIKDSHETVDSATKSTNPLKDMPPIAQLVSWLIVSHHRLPKYNPSTLEHGMGMEPSAENISQWMDKRFNWYWNSRNAESSEFTSQHFKNNWEFKHGTPIKSARWCEKARSIGKRVLRHPQLVNENRNWLNDRFSSHIARLCLMLSDHTYSAGEAKTCWQDKKYKAYANTDRNNKSALKQKLDEHNIGVGHNAYLLAKNLPKLRPHLPSLGRHKILERGSKSANFKWQDKAYQLAQKLSHRSNTQGFFGINMASTGCGKTLANAKIMYGLSDKREGCRFSIALGLRTLTLQTGDALRQRLKLTDDDLAVLIGSLAVKELHTFKASGVSDKKAGPFEQAGSESAEPLISQNEYIRYDGEIYDGVMKRWFASDEKRGKLETLLSAPVLVSTIDHLMPATEGERGGKQIAPMLRLLTADLVLDEPDDFDLADLPALCRLVNWAGMLGSRVLLSSATLPPSLVCALFEAYQSGRQQFNNACGEPGKNHAVSCAWFDETVKPQADEHKSLSTFKVAHAEFVRQRISQLVEKPILRRAALLPVNASGNQPQDIIQSMAESIETGIYQLHGAQSQQHPKTGKQVSIGLVRVANIRQMVAIAQYLLIQRPRHDSRIHFAIYHSQHPLLVRSSLEATLDEALTRHNSDDLWEVSAIKSAINQCPETNQLFIVFATAVAEVGRDHDYDWAIAEPSSMRSLIQLAGRIQRHREIAPDEPNFLILDQNYRGLNGQSVAFTQPGFESMAFKLDSKNLSETLDKGQYQVINAIPRIQPRNSLIEKQNLADLEHAHLTEKLFDTQKKIRTYASLWWKQNLAWSAELQNRTRFRQSQADERFVLYIESEEDMAEFRMVTPDGLVEKSHEFRFQRSQIELANGVQPWCDLSIEPMLIELAETMGMTLALASKKFSEIRLPDNGQKDAWHYDAQFGVYRALE